MLQVLGVVGAGTMGAGIAYVAASSLKARIIVSDIDQEALARARATMKRYGDGSVARGRATQEEVDANLGRVDYQIGLGALEAADVVVEAVFEDLEVKRATFTQLDKICQKANILSSNTSGLSVTSIAGATERPERVIGTHFFNPVPAMKLVEIVRGLQTSDETQAAAEAFCKALGKEVCCVRDFPGFVTTRIGQALMLEAIRCLEQGVADVENIDRGVKLAYNYPMGPFELADLIGLDVELKILDSMAHDLGERFIPSPLLRQMVAAGHLGRKSGRGFYNYQKLGAAAS